MNQDRELLELAAKAAGFLASCFEGEEFLVSDCFDEDIKEHVWKSWNPLIDDGDALRLAVKLGMIVVIQDSGCVSAEVPGYEMVCEYAHSTASTRRAITRAAAEIGKAMP